MDSTRFDHFSRILATSGSRRQALLAFVIAAGARVFGREETAAGPGCKNVDQGCKKKKDCCSGICKGKKGKKTCRAHDATTCEPGQRSNFCGGNSVDCVTTTGAQGTCETTTGRAAFCADDGEGVCMPCKKDNDCRKALQNRRAACVLCDDCDQDGGVGCAIP